LSQIDHSVELPPYHELAQKEPETYLSEVAQTLNDFGIVNPKFMHRLLRRALCGYRWRL
jgi:hypothetical protein